MAIHGCLHQRRHPNVVLSQRRVEQRERPEDTETGAFEPRRHRAWGGVGGRVGAGEWWCTKGGGGTATALPCRASYLFGYRIQKSEIARFASNGPLETALAGHGTEWGALTDGMFRSVGR